MKSVLVPRETDFGKRLVQAAMFCPFVTLRSQHGNLGLRLRRAQHCTHSRSVVTKARKQRPPRVTLVYIRAESYPSGESCLGRRIVEPVKNRVIQTHQQ